MELVVHDLACRRGGVLVLSGVGFRVPAGQALVLRGPNGAGKTTLLRTLAGLAPPAQGSMRPGPEAVAYAGHADGLKAALTVEDNLRFWAAAFGRRDIGPAIEAFDLGPLLRRRVQDLSAGQKRRAALARLTLTGRAIWALDEPTVSLDGENVARFGAVVRSHLAKGGIAVMATHIDLGLAEAETLDVSLFRARPEEDAGQDPFLYGAAEADG